MLILASRSETRRAMLTAAGVPYEAMAAGVDEDAAKAALVAEGLSPRDLADALAELKATRLSLRRPTDLVLGCDSTVAAPNGTLLDKPRSRDEAEAHLRLLAGGIHRLTSAAVVCQGGRPLWRHVDGAKLTVRPLSDAFLARYLDAEWPAIGGCVGCYRLEGLGAQLFAKIEGDHFTILGLPLLPLLGWLRVQGVMPS